MGSRNIKPAAIALIDEKLKYDQMARLAIANQSDQRQLYIRAVSSFLGTLEVGNNGGYEVELFLATVGLHAGDAWCMSFQQTCLAYVETKLSIASPIYASGSVINVWKNSQAQRVVNIPKPGAIAIFQHVDDPVHGHTGMVVDYDADKRIFHTIEGNQAEGLRTETGGLRYLGQQGVRFVERVVDFDGKQQGTSDLVLRGFLKPF